ncbi:hypothetical protein ACWDV7_38685, partial [Streptomyces sp. NPDC003362]
RSVLLPGDLLLEGDQTLVACLDDLLRTPATTPGGLLERLPDRTGLSPGRRALRASRTDAPGSRGAQPVRPATVTVTVTRQPPATVTSARVPVR